MLLRNKRTLGVLPEILVFMTLFLVTFGMAAVLVWTNRQDPVIFVPDALGTAGIKPAAVDDAYIRSFVVNFYSYWGTWSESTYLYRRSLAIEMMTPSVRPAFRKMAKDSGELALSLSQSQSLALTSFTIEHLSPTVSRVAVEGTIKVYYGGVGGDQAEPYHGAIMVTEVQPSRDNPFCLEVIGLTTPHVTESSSP